MLYALPLRPQFFGGDTPRTLSAAWKAQEEERLEWAPREGSPVPVRTDPFYPPRSAGKAAAHEAQQHVIDEGQRSGDV